MEVEQVVVRLIADTSQYFRALDYAGSRLLGYTAGLVAGVAKHGAELATQFEKNSVAVKVMTNDVATGVKLINDLTKLAIDTPFSSEELIGVTKQLKAFGFETNSIIPTLESLGNVSAGTGTDIRRIALAFGQVKVAGKLMGTELRQFVDAGVPLISYLAKVMNKPEESIRTLVEQGRVGFDEVVQAFNLMNAKGGQFAGLMDTISKTTIGGRWQAFKETLDVGARNFAMAAFEGLGLKNILRDITDDLQGLATGDQSKTVQVFRDIKTAVQAIYGMIRGIIGFISGVISSVYNWAVQNQHVLKVTTAILATIWSVWVAIKAATYALVLMRYALTAIYAITGIGSVVSAFWGLVSAATALVGVIASLAAPVLIISTLVALLSDASMFAQFGNGFSKLTEQFAYMKTAFNGFIDAVKAGDMETAFEIAVNGIKLIFRSLWLMLKVEFQAFIDGIGIGVKATVQSLPRRLGANVLDTLNRINPFTSQEQYEKVKTNIWDNYLEQTTEIQNQATIEQRKVNEANRQLADRLFKTDSVLLTYQKNITDASNRMREQASNKGGLDFIKNNMDQLEKVRSELLGNLERAVGANLGIDKRTVDQIVKRTAINDDLRTQNANLFNEHSPLGSLMGEIIEKEFLKNGMTSNDLSRSVYSVRTDTKNTDSIYHLLSDVSKKVVDDFSAAYGIDPNKSSIRVFPNPYNAQAIEGARYAQMAPPFTVSAKAREVFNEFTKQLDKGATDWIENVNKMKAVQEAFYGSVKGHQIAGVVGGFALSKMMGGLAGADLVRRYADVKFFEAALKEVDQHERLAPAALFGSSNAQDIINANKTEKGTTQEEILATLIAAKMVADETLKTQTKIADAMEALRKSGKLKLLGIEN